MSSFQANYYLATSLSYLCEDPSLKWLNDWYGPRNDMTDGGTVAEDIFLTVFSFTIKLNRTGVGC